MISVYQFITFWIRVGAIVFYRIRVSGRENIPRNGAFILAGNHLSNLDPPIVGSFAYPREIHFMAKEELFSKLILSWLLPRVLAFPVNRNGSMRAVLRDSVELLRDGKCLGLFPEGTRNRTGDHDARQGGAWLASQAQVPVVPCAIAGSGGAKLFRTQIKVAYGKPLYLPVGRKATKEELANFTQAIMGAIDALYGGIGGDPQG
ncbi:MAG TPA: lysophospholipid acyltransferase family protein [Candidatus Baltobacteraceae bacterium]|nr:lysophospholipid acyltransferase family protein [Candidatus Baltobacteraceae bacterium]